VIASTAIRIDGVLAGNGDPSQRRDGSSIRQTNPDGTTTLFLAGGLYKVTLDAAGQQTAVKRYYAIGGQPIALRDAGGTFYLLTDHLGSVVAVLDSSGAMVGEQRYRPFGQPRLTPGIIQTDRGFTGQQSLSAAGLVDFNARWVDSSLGMFASPDSLVQYAYSPQALNRYSYVLNNPLTYSDPTGHRACEGPNGECWYTDPDPNIGTMPVLGWQPKPASLAVVEQQQEPTQPDVATDPTPSTATTTAPVVQPPAVANLQLPAVQQASDTSLLPIGERLLVAISLELLMLPVDLSLAATTCGLSWGVAIAPDPLSKSIVAVADVVVLGADILVSFAHLSIAHWVLTGEPIRTPGDLLEWELRP